MIRRRGFLKGLCAAVPLGAAAVIAGKRPEGPDPRSDPEVFRLDLKMYHSIDPALMNYREGPPMAEGLKGASALAISPDAGIFTAAGSKVWQVKDGRLEEAADVEGNITAVAVAVGGAIWTASGTFLKVHNAAGLPAAEPVHLGERAWVTSLAIEGGRVYAADAGQRTVWVFTEDGRLEGRLDGRSENREDHGFVVPGPWFCLAAAPGELWIANPGRQRVERYVKERRVGSWGFSSMSVDGFCGCCNPTHLAILPQGGFITSEKGIPRVKIYSRDGVLLSVVAGPEAFDKGATGLAVAAASDGRILVLDPARGQLRSFFDRAREAGHESA